MSRYEDTGGDPLPEAPELDYVTGDTHRSSPPPRSAPICDRRPLTESEVARASRTRWLHQNS